MNHIRQTTWNCPGRTQGSTNRPRELLFGTGMHTLYPSAGKSSYSESEIPGYWEQEAYYFKIAEAEQKESGERVWMKIPLQQLVRTWLWYQQWQFQNIIDDKSVRNGRIWNMMMYGYQYFIDVIMLKKSQYIWVDISLLRYYQPEGKAVKAAFAASGRTGSYESYYKKIGVQDASFL